MTQRIIKFRAWDKTLKAMYEYNAAIEDLHDDCVLMQFTGLHDKNGKEIWEGDILASKKWNVVKKADAPSVVFWMDTHAEFQHKWNEGNPFHPELDFWNNEPLWKVACGLFPTDKCEVIGNIYENPEFIQSLKK
jgi:uncharacterized phage protein (TIGR01671 family)